MTLLKLTVLSLVLLQTTRAYDISPFTWKALEEAEKHARHAGTVAASLYAESVRFQQAVTEKVFTPEITPEQSCRQHTEPTAAPTASHNLVVLGFSLLAIMAAVLTGWYGGLKQAESSQALQQAKAADQAAADAREQEAAAQLAVASVANPSIAQGEGSQALAPLPDAQLQDEVQVKAYNAPDQWSTPSDSDKEEEALQEKQIHQAGPEKLSLALLALADAEVAVTWTLQQRLSFTRHLLTYNRCPAECLQPRNSWCAGVQLKQRLCR